MLGALVAGERRRGARRGRRLLKQTLTTTLESADGKQHGVKIQLRVGSIGFPSVVPAVAAS